MRHLRNESPLLIKIDEINLIPGDYIIREMVLLIFYETQGGIVLTNSKLTLTLLFLKSFINDLHTCTRKKCLKSIR